MRPLLRRDDVCRAGEPSSGPVAGGEHLGGCQHLDADHAALGVEVEHDVGGDLLGLGDLAFADVDVDGVSFRIERRVWHGGASLCDRSGRL